MAAGQWKTLSANSDFDSPGKRRQTSYTSIQGQAGPLDGPTKAAELSADRALRGPHSGLGPALRPPKATTLVALRPRRAGPTPLCGPRRARSADSRSEEHTSELQSHFNILCRLLL